MKIKRVLSLILAAVCLFGCTVHANGAVTPGDINGDGVVGSDDARLALRFSVDLQWPTSVQRDVADMDNDGRITSADARFILRVSVGLESTFGSTLYNYAHQFVKMTADELPSNGSVLEKAYRSSGKWCCYYTINDVFRPALRLAGYSEARIEQLAPTQFESAKILKAINSLLNSAEAAEATEEDKQLYKMWSWTANLIPDNFKVYMPSLLTDYYINHPEYCTVYTLHEYYDDVIEDKLYEPTDNASDYVPKVGDVVLMSNKTRTYVNGIPTVDHTAQIIKVNPDGTFVCTEGGIIVTEEEDGKPRVRERTYFYNRKIGTYQYVNNEVVIVLTVVRPDYY